MPVLPRFVSYRFRLRDDEAQHGFSLPEYLSRREVSTFYLRQEPSDRATYNCGHQLHVMRYLDDTLTFHLAGIADWKHEGRPHDFVVPVREIAARIFGSATTLPHDLFNDLDRFSIPASRTALPSLIEQYVRKLTPHFPITKGTVSYLR
jgi:hypothetical protein